MATKRVFLLNAGVAGSDEFGVTFNAIAVTGDARTETTFFLETADALRLGQEELTTHAGEVIEK